MFSHPSVGISNIDAWLDVVLVLVVVSTMTKFDYCYRGLRSVVKRLSSACSAVIDRRAVRNRLPLWLAVVVVLSIWLARLFPKFGVGLLPFRWCLSCAVWRLSCAVWRNACFRPEHSLLASQFCPGRHPSSANST